MNRRVIGVALAAIATSFSVTKDAAAEGPKRDQLDCSRAVSASERYTCDSPFLRALLGLIDNEEGRLLDLNPMSATLLLEHQAWMANRIRKGANYALRDAMAARYREIRHAIDATKAALAQRPSDEDIHRDCVALAPPLFETLMLACRVETVKGIAPGLVGQMQVWGPAQGDLALPVTGIHALAVLAVVEAAASSDTHSYKLIGWIGAEGASINDPLYVEGNGDAFLTIPKTEAGSGSTSTDVVLARPGPSEPWREIDASSWMGDLERRLPGGLLGAARRHHPVHGGRGALRAASTCPLEWIGITGCFAPDSAPLAWCRQAGRR
jgi:hypothetical protein